MMPYETHSMQECGERKDGGTDAYMLSLTDRRRETLAYGEKERCKIRPAPKP